MITQGQLIPLPALRRKGFEILVRELGPANALRFLGLHHEGSGNYTEERAQRLRDLTPDQVDQEIMEMQSKGDI